MNRYYLTFFKILLQTSDPVVFRLVIKFIKQHPAVCLSRAWNISTAYRVQRPSFSFPGLKTMFFFLFSRGKIAARTFRRKHRQRETMQGKYAVITPYISRPSRIRSDSLKTLFSGFIDNDGNSETRADLSKSRKRPFDAINILPREITSRLDMYERARVSKPAGEIRSILAALITRPSDSSLRGWPCARANPLPKSAGRNGNE